MKVIVVGAGEVGTYVADRLNRHHDVSLMEKNQERFNQIDTDKSYQVYLVLDAITTQRSLQSCLLVSLLLS
ncbi:MAG TPA: NAD-binding protein [Acidimicrobiales bacterium]|nr:NAD-binding protein [Acidimicrobiales bacterium]